MISPCFVVFSTLKMSINSSDCCLRQNQSYGPFSPFCPHLLFPIHRFFLLWTNKYLYLFNFSIVSLVLTIFGSLSSPFTLSRTRESEDEKRCPLYACDLESLNTLRRHAEQSSGSCLYEKMRQGIKRVLQRRKERETDLRK